MEDEDEFSIAGHNFNIVFHGKIEERAFTFFSEKDVSFGYFQFKAMKNSFAEDFTVPIREGQYTVGRHSECGIRIKDDGISRVHAILNVFENYMFVQDNNSANGISVNDNPVKESYMYMGDTLEIGRNVFLLLYA